MYTPLLHSWAFKVVSQPAIGILARWSCSGRGCAMPLKMLSSTLGCHLLDVTAPRLPGAANQKCLQMPRVPWGQTVPGGLALREGGERAGGEGWPPVWCHCTRGRGGWIFRCRSEGPSEGAEVLQALILCTWRGSSRSVWPRVCWAYSRSGTWCPGLPGLDFHR